MSSDIELGDDESITLACAELRSRNTFSATDAVQVYGNLRVQDRIYLNEPPPLFKAPILPSGIDPGPTKVSVGFGVVEIIAISAAPPSEVGVFTGGKPKPTYDDVYLRLSKRPVPVDLWEELKMLREAVLDLHARLKKKEYPPSL